jgi:hypothetical protein
VSRATPVSGSEASTFYKLVREAGVNDRQADYVPVNAVTLVEKIEVAAAA